MRKRGSACLEREMEQLTTEQLDELLQNELRKETPDEKVVLPILQVLRQREKDHPPQLSDHIVNAWETYQTRIATPRKEKPAKKRKSITRCVAAAAAVAVVLLAAVPFAVDADGTMDFLYRVKNGVVEFFRPGEKADESDYVYRFETANPDLQKVYDAVVKMGITEPMVPMRIPEGYELKVMESAFEAASEIVYARFEKGHESIVIQITRIENNTSAKYEKEDGVEIYDASNRKYLIVKNRDHVSAMWQCDDVEGMINTTESKEKLYDIIDSIYRSE